MSSLSTHSLLVHALLLAVAVSLIGVACGPRRGAHGSPVTTAIPADELDIDLAAGTPMPVLPTAQPSNVTIRAADQALARALGPLEVFHEVDPTMVTVRLLNHGIMDRLCGDDGGFIPEDQLVWVVAYLQDGLTMTDIAGPFHDRHLPPWETVDPTRSTPTARSSPTPEHVAGGALVVIAIEGYLNYEQQLNPAPHDAGPGVGGAGDAGPVVDHAPANSVAGVVCCRRQAMSRDRGPGPKGVGDPLPGRVQQNPQGARTAAMQAPSAHGPSCWRTPEQAGFAAPLATGQPCRRPANSSHTTSTPPQAWTADADEA